MLHSNLLSFKQVVDYTGFKLSYIYKLSSNGTLKVFRPNNGKAFIDKDWLDNWLRKNQTQTSDEIKIAASTYVATHRV